MQNNLRWTARFLTGLSCFIIASPAAQTAEPPPDNIPILRVGHVGHDHQLALDVAALDGFVMNQPGTAMAVHKGLAKVVAELRVNLTRPRDRFSSAFLDVMRQVRKILAPIGNPP